MKIVCIGGGVAGLCFGLLMKQHNPSHDITEVDSDADFPDANLIIASDGLNSKVRTKYQDTFNFLFEKTEHGWFQAHVYKFDEQTSTFIVECPEHVWLAHGLDKADQQQSIEFCEELFANNHGNAATGWKPRRLPAARKSGASRQDTLGLNQFSGFGFFPEIGHVAGPRAPITGGRCTTTHARFTRQQAMRALTGAQFTPSTARTKASSSSSTW
jgi:hypothetical protein